MRAYEAEGRKPAVRVPLPDEGETVVEDLVRGTVVFDNATLTDFVILRANGIPTYHFSAVFDDVDMAITHVIRGEDLFPSTPLHVHVFRALGRATPPAFAHLPLIVGADRRKLSKRRDKVSVQQFRDDGYLPEAMVNYLALLGWSLDDHTELFTLADLERVFSLERVSRNPAAFDIKKLDALNGHYLRQPADFAARPGRSWRWPPPRRADPALLARAAPLVQERVNHLTEVPGMVGFLFRGGRARPGRRGQGPDRRRPRLPGRGGQAAGGGRAVDRRRHRGDPARPPGGARPQAQDRLPAGPPGRHRPAGQPAPVRVHGTARQAPPWPAWTGPPPCPVERSGRRPLRCPSPWAPAHDPWGVG